MMQRHLFYLGLQYSQSTHLPLHLHIIFINLNLEKDNRGPVCILQLTNADQVFNSVNYPQTDLV